MNPEILRALEACIATVRELRALSDVKTDQTIQYGRDKLRDAEEALRSAHSALAKRIGEIISALERDRGSTRW